MENKETIEEAAREAYKKHNIKDDRLSLDEQIQRAGGFIVGFIEGAKSDDARNYWYEKFQQEKKLRNKSSEEDMRESWRVAEECWRKDETLEKASEKWYDCTEENKGFPKIKAFKEGAKWQEERMYSEEDMRNAFDSAREFNSLDGVVDVHIVLPMGGDMSDLQPLHFTFDEWFEQFEKKKQQ